MGDASDLTLMNLFSELRRRNVFRVTAAYLVIAWLALQVVDVVFPLLDLPIWTGKLTLLLLAVGLPVAIVLAWAFNLTPEGVKRASDVSAEASAPGGRRKLDIVIIVGLAAALAVSVYMNFRADEPATESLASLQPSVAVLPLANRSSLMEDAFFAEGIHDDILTHLAKIGTLKVISRTSVMEYADTQKNMRTIAEELGVATILEGGVQRSGNRVRINVQLIDAGTDNHLWAEIYDRELTPANVFAIQSEIAQAIAAALQAAISPDTLEKLDVVPTLNLQAYDYFLQAGSFDSLITGNAKEGSIDALRKAVEVDPQFGLAWAALSISLSRNYWDAHNAEARQEAYLAARRGLEAAPQLPESHLAMGYYHYWCHREYEQALAAFLKAQQLAPGASGPFVAMAYVQRRVGQFDAALENFERAIALDPRNAEIIAIFAEYLRILDRHSDAERYYELAKTLSPEDPFVQYDFALNRLEQDGDLDAYAERIEAIELLDLWLSIERYRLKMFQRDYTGALNSLKDDQPVHEWQYYYYPSALLAGIAERAAGAGARAEARFAESLDFLKTRGAADSEDPRIQMALGLTLAGLGRREEAVRHGVRATELLPYSRDRLHSLYYVDDLARIHAMNGDLGPALEQLAMVFDHPSGSGIEATFLDPIWDPFRDQPDFMAFEKRYRRAASQ